MVTKEDILNENTKRLILSLNRIVAVYNPILSFLISRREKEGMMAANFMMGTHCGGMDLRLVSTRGVRRRKSGHNI